MAKWEKFLFLIILIIPGIIYSIEIDNIKWSLALFFEQIIIFFSVPIIYQFDFLQVFNWLKTNENYNYIMPLEIYFRNGLMVFTIVFVLTLVVSLLILKKIKINTKLVLITFLVVGILIPFIFNSNYYPTQSNNYYWQKEISSQEDNQKIYLQKVQNIVKTSNPEECFKTDDYKLSDICITQLAIKLNKPDLCNRLKKDYPLFLDLNCRFEFAIQSKDFESCTDPDEKFEARCYRGIASELKDFKYCKLIRIPQDKDECFNRVAQVSQDKRACELISDQRQKEYCLNR